MTSSKTTNYLSLFLILLSVISLTQAGYNIQYLSSDNNCESVDENKCFLCGTLYYTVNCTDDNGCKQYISSMDDCSNPSPAETVDEGSCDDLTSAGVSCKINYSESSHALLIMIIVVVVILIIGAIAAAIGLYIYKKRKGHAYADL